MSTGYLHAGLPKPVPAPDGLDTAFWEGAREERLLIQKCADCGHYQWGPEWLCHRCLSFELAFEEVAPQGRIYSYERVWHPVHPALAEQGPYLVVLVDLPHADDVRLVGNLLDDPEQVVEIGAAVEAVFEHHPDEEPGFTLVQWRVRS